MGQLTQVSSAIFCQCAGVIVSMESLLPIFIAGVFDNSGHAIVQTRSYKRPQWGRPPIPALTPTHPRPSPTSALSRLHYHGPLAAGVRLRRSARQWLTASSRDRQSPDWHSSFTQSDRKWRHFPGLPLPGRPDSALRPRLHLNPTSIIRAGHPFGVRWHDTALTRRHAAREEDPTRSLNRHPRHKPAEAFHAARAHRPSSWPSACLQQAVRPRSAVLGSQ